MGAGIHHGTMPGGITPMCNECGIALCWDLSAEEYAEDAEFWDSWRCQDCNGGKPMSRKEWRSAQENR